MGLGNPDVSELIILKEFGALCDELREVEVVLGMTLIVSNHFRLFLQSFPLPAHGEKQVRIHDHMLLAVWSLPA